ncbi:MAG: CYTH domain-containing protein, partial [Actinomycetota bacterium]|nr:CYTH domain-containing protein [Actinomycetota bacterium]
MKLGVWPGFRMPDLDGVGEGTTATEVRTRRLEATYHDTPDLRLARAGVSLRFRGGDGTGWTLKLPDRSDGPRAPGGPLVRRELTFPGSSKAVPARASSLLTAWVRSATLEPAIRLHTLRRSLDVVDAGGKALAEVVDDEVSVLDGRRVAMRFREVEVEMRDGATPEVMDALVG